MKKRIVITGATGFIGKALTGRLLERGYEVVALTRDPGKARSIFDSKVTVAAWDGATGSSWAAHAEGAHAIVNLAGENVGSGLWTAEKKEKILQSRLRATAAVADALGQVRVKPQVVIQGSAAGYYGVTNQDTVFTENAGWGSGFLAEVTRQWEEAAEAYEQHRVRTVLIRTGVVLGRTEGALPLMATQHRLFFGGYTGKGTHWISWIHIEDEVRAIMFLLENPKAEGPYNLTAPQPVPASEFSRTLARVLRRPSWFHVPTFLVKTLFGEFGEEALLAGQRVLPIRLLREGFVFTYADLRSALLDLLHQ